MNPLTIVALVNVVIQSVGVLLNLFGKTDSDLARRRHAETMGVLWLIVLIFAREASK